jgi:hypothetical protein
MNKFFKTLPKNTQHGNYCITCRTNTVHAKYHYMMYLQLIRQCCTNTEIRFCLSMTSIIKCCFKRDLYVMNRNSKDPNIKNYYKAYCKLLSRSIIEAKRSYYDTLISNFNNKIKSMCNIVKAITGRKSDHDVIPI